MVQIGAMSQNSSVGSLHKRLGTIIDDEFHSIMLQQNISPYPNTMDPPKYQF